MDSNSSILGAISGFLASILVALGMSKRIDGKLSRDVFIEHKERVIKELQCMQLEQKEQGKLLNKIYGEMSRREG